MSKKNSVNAKEGWAFSPSFLHGSVPHSLPCYYFVAPSFDECIAYTARFGKRIREQTRKHKLCVVVLALKVSGRTRVYGQLAHIKMSYEIGEFDDCFVERMILIR